MDVYIVDDERPARERLKQLLTRLPGAALCGESDNGRDALTQIQTLQPDIVLLDVRMPAPGGLEVARYLAELETPPAVLFTTAYDEYAVAAFETKAVAYLLKPIRLEHLQKALVNAASLNRAQLAQMRGDADRAGSDPGGVADAAADSGPRSHLCTRIGKRLELIPVAEVIYFQAEQKYVTVRHRHGEAIIEESLKSIEQEFGGALLRVHRNALVAVAGVAGMEKSPGGRYQIVFKDIDDRLEISRRLAAGVRRAIRAL